MKIKAIALSFCAIPLAGCLDQPQQKAPPASAATAAPAQTTAAMPKSTETAATKTPQPDVVHTSGEADGGNGAGGEADGGAGAGGGWGG